MNHNQESPSTLQLIDELVAYENKRYGECLAREDPDMTDGVAGIVRILKLAAPERSESAEEEKDSSSWNVLMLTEAILRSTTILNNQQKDLLKRNELDILLFSIWKVEWGKRPASQFEFFKRKALSLSFKLLHYMSRFLVLPSKIQNVCGYIVEDYFTFYWPDLIVTNLPTLICCTLYALCKQYDISCTFSRLIAGINEYLSGYCKKRDWWHQILDFYNDQWLSVMLPSIHYSLEKNSPSKRASPTIQLTPNLSVTITPLLGDEEQPPTPTSISTIKVLGDLGIRKNRTIKKFPQQRLNF